MICIEAAGAGPRWSRWERLWEDLLGALPPGTRLLQAHLPAGKVSLNAWPLQCEIPGQLLGFNHFSLGK